MLGVNACGIKECGCPTENESRQVASAAGRRVLAFSVEDVNDPDDVVVVVVESFADDDAVAGMPCLRSCLTKPSRPWTCS